MVKTIAVERRFKAEDFNELGDEGAALALALNGVGGLEKYAGDPDALVVIEEEMISEFEALGVPRGAYTGLRAWFKGLAKAGRLS